MGGCTGGAPSSSRTDSLALEVEGAEGFQVSPRVGKEAPVALGFTGALEEPPPVRVLLEVPGKPPVLVGEVPLGGELVRGIPEHGVVVLGLAESE